MDIFGMIIYHVMAFQIQVQFGLTQWARFSIITCCLQRFLVSQTVKLTMSLLKTRLFKFLLVEIM